MKQYTKNEIEKFFREMYPHASINVWGITPKEVYVSFDSLNALTFFYDEMKKISEFFETTKIKYEDIYRSAGCPTCSCWESYSFDVKIWEEL